jgi:hypothetical protein
VNDGQTQTKTCFVIMGFGKKTAYGKKARTLDLDATYRHIIKPAVTACALRCIRADEVTHSGIIDKPMYELLLSADLVIADISTANANALYELGVRHALRPHATIVIKESAGDFHFDLNHLATLQYKHLGEDIGSTEAEIKRAELKQLIDGVLAQPKIDSPVFTFLDELKGRTMTLKEREAELKSAEISSNNLAVLLEAARLAAKDSNHSLAKKLFAQVRDLMALQKGPNQPPDPFVIQQLALATYKAKQPSAPAALDEAWETLAVLAPEMSTDPETLGIAGAIQKRKWETSHDRRCLDSAIDLYGRGFEVRRDYYNGENYAICLDLRAPTHSDAAESTYDRTTARKVRLRVRESLEQRFSDTSTRELEDYVWMLATMTNTLYAVGDSDGAQKYEAEFLKQGPAKWQIESFNDGKSKALAVATVQSA